MSQQVTIHVSEQVMRQAAQVAAQTQRSVEDVLAAWLESATTERPVEELSDEQVLALADLRFTDEQEAGLSELLERSREDGLDPDGQRRLDEMMRLYEHALLRKSQALRVAVQRGLREPFSWSEGGAKIVGLTPAGRATVQALRLNNELAVEVRRNRVLAGWHPPKS